jgi:hypothetical protein
MDHRIETRAQVDAPARAYIIPDRLSYVVEALPLVKTELDGCKALLRFGGSPWTLATYRVEGGSSKDFEKVKLLFYSDRSTFEVLREKLTEALIGYLRMQIAAGADVIHIFDSWGGAIAGADYEEASLKWIGRIVAALPQDFPVILYAKGTAAGMAEQAASGIKVLTIDWIFGLARARRESPPKVALQRAGLLQAKRGNHGAMAFDVQTVCAGFVCALSIAGNSFARAATKTAMVVGADCSPASSIGRTERPACSSGMAPVPGSAHAPRARTASAMPAG